MDLLRDTSFFLVAHPEFSVFISLSLDLKLRPYWRKDWKASWVSFFLMIREKKCLSSSSFLLGFCEVRKKIQPQGQVGFECGDSEQFWALVEESGLLLFPHMCLPFSCPLHWKEPIGLFSSAHILMTWLTEPSRRKCKRPTLVYVWDSLLRQEETYIPRLIYLWLLLKQSNRKNYLN